MLTPPLKMNRYNQYDISFTPFFTLIPLLPISHFKGEQKGAEMSMVSSWHVTIKSVLLILQDWINKVLDQQQQVWKLALFHFTPSLQCTYINWHFYVYYVRFVVFILRKLRC